MCTMMYVSQHPERVEALFLQSPGGVEPYHKDTYDPYKMRADDVAPFNYNPKDKVDSSLK